MKRHTMLNRLMINRPRLNRLVLNRLVFAGIMISFVYALSPAQGGGDSALLALVRKNYNAQASLAITFTVDQYWAVREKHSKESGTADIAPDNHFRVKMGSDLWVSDGRAVWSYSKPSNQVVVRRIDQVQDRMLPSSIFSRYLTDSAFKVVSRKAGIAQIEMTGDSDAAYATVIVWVHESTGIIQRGQMVDHNGNTFTYTFTSTVFNRKFPKETFQFAIPKSAHVVDMRS